MKKTSKQELEALFEHAPVAIFITDDIGHCVWSNTTAQKLLGYTESELIEKSIFELIIPSERMRMIEEGAKNAGKNDYRGDWTLSSKKGDHIFTEVHSKKLQDNRWISVVTDITERKQTETALKESENRFRELADSMPQIVWITDANGVTNYYNRRWYEFTGLDYNTPEYDITPFLHPDDISHSERAWQHAIKTGKPYQIEYRFKDFKREDYRWFLGRAVPVRDEKGKITKWYGTSTDIDAIKRTIRRKNELEDLATMLEEERRELLALNDAKDEFISLASHQLRTPATGVKQYIGMLLQGFFGEISPEHQEILQRAYDSNERQLRTVNDMLLVARVDANKIKLNKQLTDISELVKEAADEQRGEFEKRNQDLTVKVPKSLPASVDGAYLRMVIDNLLENASKYTYENGAIKVTLKEEKGEIVLAVKDSGVGISPKDQEKLFQKFSRIDNPLSVAAEGSGLGLYWSQKIIDMHRGTLTVSSRPNDGTTFTMRIPKKKAR